MCIQVCRVFFLLFNFISAFNEFLECNTIRNYYILIYFIFICIFIKIRFIIWKYYWIMPPNAKFFLINNSRYFRKYILQFLWFDSNVFGNNAFSINNHWMWFRGIFIFFYHYFIRYCHFQIRNWLQLYLKTNLLESNVVFYVNWNIHVVLIWITV